MREHFSDFGGRLWLNTAHQGPLPLVAAEAAREAVEWKTRPYLMTTERFSGVPRRLRELLGRLTGVDAEEIILTNGASYGLHLLANGLPLERGDEVLLMAGDFPSDILPWLSLRERGVEVRLLRPEGAVLTAAEVEAAFTSRSRALCMTWVHSFSGHACDLDGIGALCRNRGVHFLLNTTQGLGARPLDLSTSPVDAVVNAGWKWLCGPYGTGFCWIRPELLRRLRYNQAYWLATMTADDLGREELDLESLPDPGARRYDLFATANFFNFAPWGASLELLLDLGLERIHAHDEALVERLLAGLDRDRFELLSPEAGPARSTLVFLSHRDRLRNRRLHRRLAGGGIYVAYRKGSLRLSPHLHNDPADVDLALELLHGD